MEDEILFREVQKFRQWWLWVILIAASVTPLVVLVVINGKQQLGNKFVLEVFIVALATLVPILLFLFMKLETQVRRDGVFLKFFPFHFSFKEFRWGNISEVYIRQYNPLSEYGGWGLRFGPSGKAYSVSGNKGLQLELDNGKRILIGTNKQDELTEVLRKIGHLKQ